MLSVARDVEVDGYTSTTITELWKLEDSSAFLVTYSFDQNGLPRFYEQRRFTSNPHPSKRKSGVSRSSDRVTPARSLPLSDAHSSSRGGQ